MSEKNKKVKKQKKLPSKNGGQYSLLIILVMVVLIAIPSFLVGTIIYDAYMKTGVPMVGQRFENDLPNKITEEHITNIEKVLASVENVESVNAELKSATLRVYVNVEDSFEKEGYPDLTLAVYEKLASVLPVEKYFTSSSNVKNYDLEMNVFQTSSKATKDTGPYFVLQKNAPMPEPKVYNYGDPVNPQLVEDLFAPEVELPDGSDPASDENPDNVSDGN